MTTGPQLALPINVTDDGEIRMYRIVLPFLPPSKNVYDNWPIMWKNAAKKKWANALAKEVAAQMMPLGCKKIGLAATLVFPAKAHRDPQNYAQALWHWVPDGLQKAGLIPDDTEGMIEIGPNWGLSFAYDGRVGLPKKRRERTILAVTMLCPTDPKENR